jgi:hypothetical protein
MLAALILVSFILASVKEGIISAIGGLTALTLIIFTSKPRHMTTRRHRQYDYDIKPDEEGISSIKPGSSSSPFARIRKWPTDIKDIDYLAAGPSIFLKHQQDALRRAKKNLWG